jgi:hypothetical protein
MPAEEPFILVAQISTISYFSFFIIITPFLGWLENYLLFSPLRGEKSGINLMSKGYNSVV